MRTALIAMGLWGVACGGGGTATPAEPSISDPVAARPLPDGFVVEQTFPSGATVARRDKEVAIASPEGAWWYEPSKGIVRVDDAGEGYALVIEHKGYAYVNTVSGDRHPASGFFSRARPFVEGRAWAQDGAVDLLDSHLDDPVFGFVLLDEHGAVVHEFKDEILRVEDFSGGLAAAETGKRIDPGDPVHEVDGGTIYDEGPTFETGLQGYVDKTGTWTIPAQYKIAHSFAGGQAKVVTSDGTHALIDTHGVQVGTW